MRAPTPEKNQRSHDEATFTKSLAEISRLLARQAAREVHCESRVLDGSADRPPTGDS